jgi:hypothetical protein
MPRCSKSIAQRRNVPVCAELAGVGNAADDINHRKMPMKKIAIFAAAATIAGIGFASAQGTGTGSSTLDPNKCWDVSTNTIKDKPSAMGSTTGSASGGATSGSTAGSTPSGSAGSTAGSAGSSSSSGTAAAARPAGMPSC